MRTHRVQRGGADAENRSRAAYSRGARPGIICVLPCIWFFSACVFGCVESGHVPHVRFLFGHRFAGRVRRGHRAMRAADGGPQPTIERSCPRGRRLRAAGQTAQAKWIAARLKTLSNHGPAGPIQIAGFVVGFGVRALAPGCAAPPARAAYGRSARRGL